MQETQTHPQSDPDPAGTTAWDPSKPSGPYPTLAAIPNEPIPPPPPWPSVGSALLLALGGFLLAPFAWIGWWFANKQLKAIERGERNADGKPGIVLARRIAQIFTVVNLVIAAILVSRM